MKPFFSVVLPTYNRRVQIQRCLESICQQTFKDFEIIVVDDGSTDDTKEFISQSYPSVTYCRQENQGVSRARNVGLQKAQGRYIAFMDSDDLWYAHRLELLHKIVTGLTDDVGLIFNDMDWLENGKGTGCSYSDDYFKVKRTKVLSQMDASESFTWSESEVKVQYGHIFDGLLHGNIIQPSCAIMKRSVFTSLGGFREDFRVANDSEYFLRISKHVKIGYVPLILTSLDPPRSTISLSLSSSSIEKINNMILTIKNYWSEEKDWDRKKQLRIRLAGLHDLLGYHYLTDYDIATSRLHYKTALRLTPLRFKSYAMLLLTIVPVGLLKEFAKTKRKIKRSYGT